MFLFFYAGVNYSVIGRADSPKAALEKALKDLVVFDKRFTGMTYGIEAGSEALHNCMGFRWSFPRSEKKYFYTIGFYKSQK